MRARNMTKGLKSDKSSLAFERDTAHDAFAAVELLRG